MKDVNKAEIKQQNRKAMPKFIVIMTLSVLIGGAFGFCTSYYGLNGFAGKLTAAGTYFSSRMLVRLRSITFPFLKTCSLILVSPFECS